MKKLFLTVLSGLFMGEAAFAGDLDFAMGKALFDRPWSSAPASTQATDGLGPLFNARACVACHPKGGRGSFSIAEDGKLNGAGLLLRLGDGQGNPDPVYGRQLQTNAVQGFLAEGHVYKTDQNFRVTELAYGPLDQNTKLGGRLAQSLLGLGLLEQIPEEVILALADPDDVDGDGISGRANQIGGKLGRFNWKASAPDLRIQSANAFLNDVGMSTPVNPVHAGDCTAAQKDCLDAPHGDSPQFDNVEISGEMLRMITVYVSKLEAPLTEIDQGHGYEMFKSVGCASCHIPEFTLEDGQKIHAFTDLLLHDMGADLADGIVEGLASGQEWRTQPLWGSSNTTQFLHDGRASSVKEAIQWHGGEAATARLNFDQLEIADQQALLEFVESL